MSALNISKIVKIFAHHLGYQHHSRQILCLILPYQLAVTKNCDPVANCINLFQEMSNKDNSNSLIPKPSHKDKQLFNLVIIQRRGWLIQDQHLAFHIHCTGNGDHLLNSH